MAVLGYEEQRLQNIKDNEALLLSLGLSAPAVQPKTPVKRPAITKKRKSLSALATSTPKTPRLEGATDPETPESGLRRSGRTRVKVVYSDIGLEAASISRATSARTTPTERRKYESTKDDDESVSGDEVDGRQRMAQRLGVRTQNPKKFGHIKGVEVGTWWPSRMDASTAAIHAPTVAGISGNSEDGAWSVALSGGYADDVDLGEAFTYTGSGGRDLKGTKQNPKNLRTAPQTSDQTFDNPKNAALMRSAETRKPVRVIRGFKLVSPYAPTEGYRYDGLYIVEKAWLAKGLTKGLKVCRYAFKRVPGQTPLPIRSADEEDVADEE